MPNRAQRRRLKANERVAAKKLHRIRAEAAKKVGHFRAATGFAVTIKAAEGEGAERKLPTFSGVAYTGAPMRPEGFYTPIICDLNGFVFDKSHPALRQHDHEQIVGHTTSIKASEKDGLSVEGVFSGQDEHAKKVTDPASKDFPWQFSIGADPIETSYLESGEEGEMNGRKITGPMILSHKTKLGEISFVPRGADSDTSAEVHASANKGLAMFKLKLKALMNGLRAAGQVKAAKYSDDEIDKMDEKACKSALKKCMAADNEDTTDADDDTDVDAADDDDNDQDRADAAAALTIKATRKAQGQEMARIDGIRAAAKKYGVETITIDKTPVNLVAHATIEGWTVDKVELEALKASRPGPGVGVPGGLVYMTATPELSERTIEAAILQAAKSAGHYRLDDDSFYVHQEGPNKGERRMQEHVEKKAKRIAGSYTDKEQQYAYDLFKDGISLQRVLASCARLNGWRGSINERITLSSGSEIMRFAAGSMFGGVTDPTIIRAEGSSTASLANVTSNVQNKLLLQGYLWCEQVWRMACAIRSMVDFKPSKSINLLGDMVVKEVGPSGEIESAVLDDQAFANQVDQFARLLTITRKNIINDDIGALTTAPLLLGRGAGLALNQQVWGMWNYLPSLNADDGASFFANSSGLHTATPSDLLQTPGNANYLTNGILGSSTALSSAALQQAKLLYDNQIDPFGQPMPDEQAPTLLISADNWVPAKELVLPQSTTIVYGGGSAAKQPQIQVWAGWAKLAMSKYLNKTLTFRPSPGVASSQNKVTATGSTTAWYVLFDPAVCAALEVAFLNGVDTPTVQMASQDFQFDRLGMSSRVIFDFGVTQQNFRAAVKMNGA
jgi:hypothetical protein